MIKEATKKIKTIGKVVTGKTPPTKNKEFFGEDYNFVTPSDIPTYEIKKNYNTGRGLSKKGFEKQKNYLIPQGSICYVCIGSTIGKICMAKSNCFTNQQINTIIPFVDQIDKDYLFYKMRVITPEIQSIGQGKGAGKGIMNKTEFENYEITIIEDLKLQKKIATILSNYDYLIENNEKRIKILEQMAKLIYEEWFVKFKFPEYENVKMVDSKTEFGKIPEGWEVKTIGEVLAFIKKGPSLKYTSQDKGIPVLNQKCIRDNKIDLQSIQYAEPIKDKDLLLRKFDLLVNSMGVGTLGRVSLNFNILEKMIIHNCITVLRANEDMIFQSLLYFNLLNKETELINLSTGSTGQTTLKPSSISSIEIIVPKIGIQKYANEIFIKIFDEIGLLQRKNQNLRKTRDFLLPKLITGEVDVSNLDIKVSDEVANT